MSEIYRSMMEEASTKDVFRELDGYLLVINGLATLHPILEEDDSCLAQVEEGARLAFMLLCESLANHPLNLKYFEVRK